MTEKQTDDVHDGSTVDVDWASKTDVWEAKTDKWARRTTRSAVFSTCGIFVFLAAFAVEALLGGILGGTLIAFTGSVAGTCLFAFVYSLGACGVSDVRADYCYGRHKGHINNVLDFVSG